MIKKILLLLFIVFASQRMCGQIHSGEVVYKVKPIEKNNQTIDSLKTSHQNAYEYFKRKRQKNARLMPYLDFRLKFNGHAALFKRKKEMRNDNGMNLRFIRIIRTSFDG